MARLMIALFTGYCVICLSGCATAPMPGSLEEHIWQEKAKGDPRTDS